MLCKDSMRAIAIAYKYYQLNRVKFSFNNITLESLVFSSYFFTRINIL